MTFRIYEKSNRLNALDSVPVDRSGSTTGSSLVGDLLDMDNMVEGTTTKIMTDAERTKLAGIEASATADQTGAEIKTAYEAEANTNAYTDAEKTKLAGIEASADVTDATNVAAAGAHMSGGTDVPVTDGGTGASDAATARSNLGLGTISTQNADSVTISGGTIAGQLGGSLDVNGQKIVSVSDGNIDIEPNGTGNVLLGNLTFDADQVVGAGQDNYVLTFDNGTGVISLEAASGGGLADVVDDTSPQLGGNLDVNGQEIVSVSNGNITLNPDGTGVVVLTDGKLTSNVADGGSAEAFVLNTANILSTSGAKAFVVKNNGTEMLSLDKDMRLTLTSGVSTGTIRQISGGATQILSNNSITISPTSTSFQLSVSSVSSPPGMKLSVATGHDLTLEQTGDGNLILNPSGTGNILVPSIPTSDPTVAGALWNNSGVLTVSAG